MNSNRTMPVIKFDIEGMRHTMLMYLSEYAAQMDKDIKDAVDDFCTDGNLTRIIRETAQRQIKLAVEEEVSKFFQYSGEGRKMVALAVREALFNKQTLTPLDEL